VGIRVKVKSGCIADAGMAIAVFTVICEENAKKLVTSQT
jgi:hypothetical protein